MARSRDTREAGPYIDWRPTASGCVGLDFGTTNSAVAIVTPGGPRLAHYQARGDSIDVFRSVLNFEQLRETLGTRFRVTAGPGAIARYLEAEIHGRLIQSLKSCLADRRFDKTLIFGRRFTLEELIALFVRHLLAQANASLGAIPRRAVVGRPVHFTLRHGRSDDELATSRLVEAIGRCGFDEVVFEYEPVAAAYTYERTLTRDEVILIGDFGGGTSDFCILRVGPGVQRRGRRPEDILGTAGVAVAGDAFDRQVVRHLVAPRLGMDAVYLSPPDKRLPMPAWPFERLERWHHVSFLNNPPDLARLDALRRRALPPAGIEALIQLVQEDLGFQLYEAVRRTKFELSERERARFHFQCGTVTIEEQVTRSDFVGWIREELDAIAGCLDALLVSSGVLPHQIDRVFLTGGSSFVPAVRRLIADRLGEDKITGGRELTSVATGLALRAAEVWPAASHHDQSPPLRCLTPLE